MINPAWRRSMMTLPLLLGVSLRASNLAAQVPDSRAQATVSAVPKLASDVPHISFTQFTLPNGLRVVLHEDHSSPIVAVQMFSHVGSKNEVRGKTGIAHLFEHLADEGNDQLNSDMFQRVVRESGGLYNADTHEDWTRYWATVPSNQLETMLWLQGGRLASQRPSEARFRSERDAVDNEYRQNVLNNVGTRIGEIVFATLFAGTTYQTPLHGYEEDRKSATLDDVIAFGKKYQVPNNSVLVIAGDVAPAEARKMVTKYFSRIPAGPAVTQPGAPAPFTGETRLALENPTATTKQLWLVWRGASSSSADRMPLTALNSVLSSRLSRLLISDRHVATSLNVAGLGTFGEFDLEKSGVFQATAVVTGSLTETEQLVDSVIADIKTNGVTQAEINRFLARFRTDALEGMLSVQSKALTLGDAAITQNDPGSGFKDIERAIKLVPADLQRVARKYLGPDRVVLSMVPAGKLAEVSKPDAPYTSVPWKK
jgi:zinc protease